MSASQDLKNSIRNTVRNLRIEVIEFIENRAENKEKPRVPFFYIKGYNALKTICKAVGQDYKDPTLELLPFAIQTTMLSEFGPIKMPELNEFGFLEEKEFKNESIKEGIDRFFEDTLIYVEDFYAVHEKLPENKNSIHLMINYFDELANGGMVGILTEKLIAHLQKELGDLVPEDFLERK